MSISATSVRSGWLSRREGADVHPRGGAAVTTFVEPRFTLAEWSRMFRTTTRDKSYLQTPLGPDVAAYLAWKKLSRASERTLDQYERDLSRLCRLGLRLERITHLELMLVLEVFPPKSWKRARAAWGDMFRWAIREGRRPDNPLDRLPKLRPEATAVFDIFSPNELELLVAATRLMECPLVQRVRALTMIESGGRASELRGLVLGDFDLVRKTVKLRGKGSKERLVGISPELVAAVDEYQLLGYPLLERQPELTDHVWYAIWVRGRRVIKLTPERLFSYRGFYEWWCRLERLAGVRHRKPHIMRHTFATDLLDATEGDLYAVKERLGHASTRTTEAYLHSSRRRTSREVEALAAYRRRLREDDDS